MLQIYILQVVKWILMYILPKLDYPYDALEPYIDKETMLIHHTKHHKTYLDNLNDTLSQYPDFQMTDAESLLKNSTTLPENIKLKVINNGGGYVNHNLYWKTLSPNSSNPVGMLLKTLESTYGSIDIFKEKFSNAALTLFGSGWGWLVINSNKLEIISTSNQNNPISEGKTPILGIDVWEHAYYLKYQNKRVDYINAWWNIVDWKYVASLFEKHML
ncbi:MAG: Superoxide dismutase [Candidatus Woesebacteria bacterium GW2011_GWB1_38_5]|uniref:Superoxide dismutase n=4 Tax=Candidatus Woeseibacteriota TaxID=1752722 RepID=A0A0G0L8K8_9BACT|nr:MAG: Superoxide dismutase [Candidatus Woesebacteria bacterium GW2011_GWD1_38_10]KKQ55520.1 MAG: Superoxide dismutase [Candidatus Woesebacteria bacterium GW2011_GWC1_38_13]KKQ75472.1 MAG: Superoxide dismutase [Candidatus Woesebacteria bacterium GW2011_GWB1_38_5]KKQ84180.1 MAG: Superoxide dismutase [Candidatus Woesebacteria bacterium GW2011_GWA1_38_8]